MTRSVALWAYRERHQGYFPLNNRKSKVENRKSNTHHRSVIRHDMDGKEGAIEVTSTQKSLSSSHEPGWNDPPKWAFAPRQDEAATNTPTKKLNRRVAFPLNSTASRGSRADQPTADFPGNLPPLPGQGSCLTSAPHTPLSTPSTRTARAEASYVGVDRDRALSETLKNFEAVTSKELESSGKTEEVTRRLEAMKIMWEEDKLTDVVCEKILEISKALRNDDVDAADKMHVSLIVDHFPVCNTWISGIRHMILELREKSSKVNSVSANEGSHPYLLPQPVKPTKTHEYA